MSAVPPADSSSQNPGPPGGPSRGPSADVSVRVAWADDAPAIAEVQVRAWRETYADLLPRDLLEALDPGDFAEAWHQSLNRPQDARNRVLVCLERNTVTGFAVTGPATDPDLDPVAEGEVGEVTVDPTRLGRGHGSRLVQACADTLRADRFTRAVLWLNADDDARRRFLTEAGWGADGAHRELDLHGDGTIRVKQVRLHTSLVEGES